MKWVLKMFSLIIKKYVSNFLAEMSVTNVCLKLNKYISNFLAILTHSFRWVKIYNFKWIILGINCTCGYQK